MFKEIWIILLIVSVFMSCNSANNQNATKENMDESGQNASLIFGHQLFDSLELPVYVENIEANKGKQFIIPTGAKIKIPLNAFVDNSGKDVKGIVTIKYKEIKSASDIMIENVDMTYDSAGQNYQFATGGMFDLRAFSGNEELRLKKDKNIEVSFESDKRGNYNVYNFDNGWKYQGMPKAVVTINDGIKESGPEYGLLVPTAVKPDEDLIVDIKISTKSLPELAMYKNVLWKYTGKLKNAELIEMLGSGVANPGISRASKGGEYIYKFSTKKGNFEIPVKPVFSPKALREALKTYQTLAANKNYKPKIMRTVNVSQLGLMNCDYMFSRPDAITVKADFKIKNSTVNVKGLPLFFITGQDNVLVNISNNKPITFSKLLSNKIVAVLPGRKVAVIGTADFLQAVENKIGKQVIIELTEMDKYIESPDDLDKIISRL